GLLVGGRSWAQGQAPAVVPSEGMRPALPNGVQSGDVTGDRAIVWSKTDRPARLLVEYATNDGFRNARRITGPAALAETDFTARVDLSGLPAGQDIFYRVTFQDLADPRVLSAPASGRFRTPPSAGRTITFAWSGDEAGQGGGVNPEWGGMKMYAGMRAGLLHPSRRSDLRGKPNRGRGEARRRLGVEERDEPRQGEGGGEPRRVPGQFRLQLPRREQAAVLCRGATARAVG